VQLRCGCRCPGGLRSCPASARRRPRGGSQAVRARDSRFPRRRVCCIYRRCIPRRQIPNVSTECSACSSDSAQIIRKGCWQQRRKCYFKWVFKSSSRSYCGSELAKLPRRLPYAILRDAFGLSRWPFSSWRQEALVPRFRRARTLIWRLGGSIRLFHAEWASAHETGTARGKLCAATVWPRSAQHGGFSCRCAFLRHRASGP
jgi:hypothetical protein